MSKYIEIYDNYKNKILNGEYKFGEKLPGEAELMRMHGYSRVTVNAAMNKLKSRNFITRRRGDGSYVSYKSESGDKSKTVALVLSNKDMYLPMISSIRDELLKHDIKISLYYTELSTDTERFIYKKVVSSNICGIICYPNLFGETANIWNNLILENFPIIFLDRFPVGIPCSSVLDNGYDNMFKMTCRIIGQGHRDIAYFTLPFQTGPVMLDRYSGFSDALRKHGLTINNKYLSILPNIHSNYSAGEIIPNILTLLSLPKRPSVIICANDVLSKFLLQTAESCGLQIPEDFSIVGHDGGADPGITTTMQNYEMIGQEAAKLLINRIMHNNNVISKIYVPGIFYEGKTLAVLNR